MSNLYEVMTNVYQLRKTAEVTTVDTKENLVLPTKLIYSLLGLALGGLLSDRYLVSEKDTDFERTLKMLLGAGGGATAGYYHDVIKKKLLDTAKTLMEGSDK